MSAQKMATKKALNMVGLHRERDILIQQAKLAEQAERFEDMAAIMKAATKTGIEMNYEERKLFSVAYSCVIWARRSSLNIVGTVDCADITDRQQQMAHAYREKIQGEVRGICNEVFYLIDKFLIPSSSNPEGKVFFLKMKADTCCYLVVMAPNDRNRREIIGVANKIYKDAYEICKVFLLPANPTRLAFAFNYSVFIDELKNSRAKAYELLKVAFDKAITELHTLNEERYKDSILIIQLLRLKISDLAFKPMLVV